MSVTVNVTSGPKGSNPGGECTIFNSHKPFPAYFKYVFGSNIGNPTNFIPNHQPIYEALTFRLAQQLGLKTVEFYVLMNKAKNVKFEGWQQHLKRDPSGRDFYFVSRIQPRVALTTEEQEMQARRLLEGDNPYLDAILIADVIGKPNNYQLDSSGDESIVYIDLGCSFVHANEGILKMPQSRKAYSINARDQRKITKRLSRLELTTRDGRVINLGRFMENLPLVPIPVLNTPGAKKLNELVGGAEIEEIRKHLSYGFINSASLLEERNLLRVQH